jgi:predicted DNA-binding protein
VGAVRKNPLRREEDKVMKTLAVRLDDELHARVGMLSKLSGTTVTDTIRTAIENHLDVLANDPAITAKAKELTAEIDKEAELQRQALAALFGSSAKEAPKTAAQRGEALARVLILPGGSQVGVSR